MADVKFKLLSANYKILKFNILRVCKIEDDILKRVLEELLRELREMKEDIKELKELMMAMSTPRNIQDEINRAISNLGKQIHKLPRLIVTSITKDFEPLRMIFYPQVKFDLDDKKRQIEKFLDEIEEELTLEENEKMNMSKIDEQIIENMAYTIEALSNPDRLKILIYLLERPRYFSELEDLLNMGPSSLRHHLSKLISLGLIRQERSRGKYLITRKGALALFFTYRFYKEIFSEV